jgi:hypothetical protein
MSKDEEVKLTDEDLKKIASMTRYRKYLDVEKDNKTSDEKYRFDCYKSPSGCLYEVPKHMSLREWVKMRKQLGLPY